jgi:hypothetical protein
MADRRSFGDAASNRKEVDGARTNSQPPKAHAPGDRTLFVRARIYANASGVKTMVVVLLSIGAALVGAALIAVFALQPPALGWVGFAIVSIIVLGLGALAPIAFERTRVSPQRPARAVDTQQRLLVVADSHGSEIALSEQVFAHLQGAGAVHLVVPVRVSHLHFVTDDESDERREAEQTMSISVGLLRQRGLSATGSVGTDKPLESMTDALGSFPAIRVLLVTPPEEESYWLERGLLTKARALTTVPVAQLVVPSTAREDQQSRV